eukprot:7712035-Karenia_brevis.AAC.1
MEQAQCFSRARRSQRGKPSSSFSLVSQLKEEKESSGNLNSLTCDSSEYELEESEGDWIKIENKREKEK